MTNLKNNLLDVFHTVLSQNVLGDQQYESRFKGFIGELSFQEWARRNRDLSIFYTGGYLLPRTLKKRSIESPIYFTVSPDRPDRYSKIYFSLSKLDCEAMFFIHWNKEICFSQWQVTENILQGAELKIPSFTVYQFNKALLEFKAVSIDTFLNYFPLKESRTQSRPIPHSTIHNWKNKLLSYEYDDLLELYVQRLFFDGFIGYSREHGIPSDIDSIVFSKKSNSYFLLEIKEKDISKRPPRGFGMDTDRINDLTILKHLTGLDIFYIVRQIDNQTNRNLVAWKIINLHDFSTNLSETTLQGGSGMGIKNGQYPTRICPYEYFKDLK